MTALLHNSYLWARPILVVLFSVSLFFAGCGDNTAQVKETQVDETAAADDGAVVMNEADLLPKRQIFNPQGNKAAQPHEQQPGADEE